ncbi:MAG: histidine phosphatase family protein [Actinomycetota bacterium]|nr:histidine phosphatase family protein [Actinomycetota bacterium]MDQ6945205.1 histidine phosphatase family protein [Actinomycetota bacterium]
MLVLLVRHAHAGTRAAWRGDDQFRPLSSKGAAQAGALARVIAPFGPTSIVTSPLVRCLQTVAPLAATTGIRVATSERLVPQAGEAAVTLLADVGSGGGPVVVCTHGEVIADLHAYLTGHDGVHFGAHPAWPKASIWLLTCTSRRFTKARYVPPPPAVDGATEAPGAPWG